MTALLTEGCLKPHPFVDGCSCEFLNHLEEFSREVDFKAGETILREGNYADTPQMCGNGGKHSVSGF